MTKITTNLEEKEYRAHAGVSVSQLKALAGGIPAEARVPVERTEAMDFGTLFHAALLEPGKFGDGISHHVKPVGMKFSTKEGKAWQETHSDLPVVPAVGKLSAFAINAMLENVAAMPEAARILAWPGDTEVAFFAPHPETGLLMKGRADRLVKDDSGKPCIFDIKTTDDPCGFDRQAANMNYHMQAAYYLRLAALNGIEDATFIFVVVGTSPPYAVRLCVLDADAIARGLSKCDRMLRLWAACDAANSWPAYRVDCDLGRVGIETVTLPKYVN